MAKTKARITVRWLEPSPEGDLAIREKALSGADVGWEIQKTNFICAYTFDGKGEVDKSILVPIDNLLCIEED